MKKAIKIFSAAAMALILLSVAAFAQTTETGKIELNKLGDSKDVAYDMKGGETRKFEIVVKEAGNVQFSFPIYAPMFKSAEEFNAADNILGRQQPSNVTLQKSLEWKLKSGTKDVASGTNVVKFAQLTNKIIPSSIQYDQFALTPGTYTFEIKCEPHFTVCNEKATLRLLNPTEQAPDPANMGP